ncbi:YybS family protein [Niallia sp. NCCP-28]|uniref:YybS family protein n=1 Tax=Niallia sp. NCCP-28 TaxID=2934712 RepID=UPI002087AFE4|nr:YybS family protein [Niallia sp. NCCP-28]GKU81399.1 hypothetical protein NCCP28_07950 [Niallia sp. NCCP-28]
MRFGEKNLSAGTIGSKLLGVNFHDFIEKESRNNVLELAAEFGLSVGEVKQLKKQLERN